MRSCAYSCWKKKLKGLIDMVCGSYRFPQCSHSVECDFFNPLMLLLRRLRIFYVTNKHHGAETEQYRLETTFKL